MSKGRGLWRPGDPMPSPEEMDQEFKGLGLDFDEDGSEEDTGPRLRLLRCTTCRSVEELPYYEGDPHLDVLLDDLVYRHNRKHPNTDGSDNFLMWVTQAKYDKHKKAIHKAIWADMKTTGFVPEYYDSKSTFNEDAANCFKQHHRQVPCIDWHSDRKRVGNPTKEGWKSGAKIYICDFCPVAAKVQEAKNKAKGLE